LPDIRKLLWPETVAVIGASPNVQSLRGMTLSVLLSQPFAGRVYAVNASHKEIQGQKAHASVADIPEPVDLAVLIIPAQFVIEEMERCGKAGVKAAAIITSGFAEQADESGQELQRQLKEIIERYDMAVIGPNAQGYANLAASLCPTFSPAMRNPELPLLPEWHKDGGRVAAIAQSGALGFSFYDRGRLSELPFRYVVTTGNEAGLHAFDLVDFMLDEGETDVFILFLEDIRDPAVFRRVAEKALKAGKPIIATKVGASEAGRLSAASHTGALAGSHRVNQAMFDAYSVVTARDQDEMIALASAFLKNRHRLPKGRNIGISSGTGGGAGWLSDECYAKGLDVPELDPATRARIDAILPPYGSSRNPVDGTAQAIREVGYGRLLGMVAQSDRIDALAMITSARAGDVYLAEKEDFFRVGQETDKPIVAWTYTWPKQETIALFAEAGYPLMTNLSNAALALAEMADYRDKRDSFIPPLEAGDGSTRTDLASRAGVGGVIPEYAAREMLAAAGIGKAVGRLVSNGEEAAEAARAFGSPLAMKIQAAAIPHKSDIGGVALAIEGPEAAAAAFGRIMDAARTAKPDAQIDGILVEPMARRGVEMIIGVQNDALFGPMILIGAGGIYAELLDDTVLSPPLANTDAARALIGRLKVSRMLEGARGRPPADIDALADTLVALSRFAVDNAAELREIDINPVLVHENGGGVSIVDALIITGGPG
jgi:acetate---CoA ligase (ADP-forming)